jgi:hypothetical protein
MIDFPSSPTDGQIFQTPTITYQWDGAFWLAGPPNSAVADAPSDGLLYGRKDATWTPVADDGQWVITNPTADEVVATLPSAGLGLTSSIVLTTGDPGFAELKFDPNNYAFSLTSNFEFNVSHLFLFNETGIRMDHVGETKFDINWLTGAVFKNKKLKVTNENETGFIELQIGDAAFPTTSLMFNWGARNGGLIFEDSEFRFGGRVNFAGLNALATPAMEGITVSAMTDPIVIAGKNVYKYRWKLFLGDGTPEPGANAGGDFKITRWDDAGTAELGTPLSISRATGQINFELRPTVAGVPMVMRTELDPVKAELTTAKTNIEDLKRQLALALARIHKLEHHH